MTEEIICKECGKKEKHIALCSGCEDYFCYKSGCNWITKKKGLFICETCYPVESHSKFIMAPPALRIERLEKIILIGEELEKALNLLKNEGYTEKYRLEEEKIIKYGKNCGIYLLFSNENRISAIGIWHGCHETDKGIGLGSSKEEMIKVYGNNFTSQSEGIAITCYNYSNLRFKLIRVGQEREVITEIIII
ncbi:MAG TPA: hypothetical protein PL110_03765 [Candidatus Eremiobacteraeota bacterium]|nr:MAG: hypothetical protein BWY64_00747 [bacterium ADurb.Bin363]HPZ07204.1 hypothetical protein [Candidatus Eremiobacteraeota bacterium]